MVRIKRNKTRYTFRTIEISRLRISISYEFANNIKEKRMFQTIQLTLTGFADRYIIQIIGTINAGKNSESEKHESRFQESHCVRGSFEEYVRKMCAPLDFKYSSDINLAHRTDIND